MKRFAVTAVFVLGAALSACSSVGPARPEADAGHPPAVAAPASPQVPQERAATAAPTRSVPPVRVRTVRDVQQRLLDLGYDPGEVDGVSGPAMRAALGAFQKDQGLRPTGRMDSPTREALSAGR